MYFKLIIIIPLEQDTVITQNMFRWVIDDLLRKAMADLNYARNRFKKQ